MDQPVRQPSLALTAYNDKVLQRGIAAYRKSTRDERKVPGRAGARASTTHMTHGCLRALFSKHIGPTCSVSVSFMPPSIRTIRSWARLFGSCQQHACTAEFSTMCLGYAEAGVMAIGRSERQKGEEGTWVPAVGAGIADTGAGPGAGFFSITVRSPPCEITNTPSSTCQHPAVAGCSVRLPAYSCNHNIDRLYISLHTYIHIHIYINLYIYLYLYICMYIYSCIYTFMYIYVHMNIYTCIYMCVCV